MIEIEQKIDATLEYYVQIRHNSRHVVFTHIYYLNCMLNFIDKFNLFNSLRMLKGILLIFLIVVF